MSRRQSKRAAFAAQAKRIRKSYRTCVFDETRVFGPGVPGFNFFAMGLQPGRNYLLRHVVTDGALGTTARAQVFAE